MWNNWRKSLCRLQWLLFVFYASFSKEWYAYRGNSDLEREWFFKSYIIRINSFTYLEWLRRFYDSFSIICRIWPIISLVYSVVLLCATGKDGSLFSLITSLCMYWIVGKVMRGVCKFQVLPAAIAALSSLANFVLSCIITKSENELTSVCNSFYVLSLVVLYYGYKCCC